MGSLFHSGSQEITVVANKKTSESSAVQPAPSDFKGKTCTTSPTLLAGSDQEALPGTTSYERANATFLTLARNIDIWGIARSIHHVEDRFNPNYNYDWVFLNDDDFDERFKNLTTALTSGRARYGKIDSAHWGFPEFIDQNEAAKAREEMHKKKILYGDSVSYRHMCMT